MHLARRGRAGADHLRRRSGHQPHAARARGVPEPGRLQPQGPHPRLRRSRSAAARRLPRRAQGRRHHPLRRQAGDVDVYAAGHRADQPRRLPHRHGQARRARLLALLRPARAPAPGRAGQDQLLHVRRGLRRPRRSGRLVHPAARTGRAPSSSAPADGPAPDQRPARQRVLLPAVLPGDPRRVPAGPGHRSDPGAVGRSGPTTWGTAPATGGIGVAPSDIPVNFLDNHDVPRFLYSVQDRRARRAAPAAAQRARRSSSPRPASRASTTAPSRSFAAATIRPTARICGTTGYDHDRARPSSGSPSSPRSAAATPRCGAAT